MYQRINVSTYQRINVSTYQRIGIYMSKTANLTSSLVTKKGLAKPVLTNTDIRQNKVSDYYKALTVKLDKTRYESLKNIGLKLDKKSQEIFVEALDLWIKKQEM